MSEKIEAICDALEAELTIANETKAAWPNARADMLRQQLYSQFYAEAERSQRPWIIAIVASIVAAALVYGVVDFRGNDAAMMAVELFRLATVGVVFWVALKFGRDLVIQDLKKRYRGFVDF
jgi:hypothetical protein